MSTRGFARKLHSTFTTGKFLARIGFAVSKRPEKVCWPRGDLGIQFGFLHLAAGTAHVDNQSTRFANGFHRERHALLTLGGLSRLQYVPIDGSAIRPVHTALIYCGEIKLDGPSLNFGDNS